MSEGYRSSRLKPAPGATVLEPVDYGRSRRLLNAVADVTTLPAVAARKPSVTVAGREVPIERDRWAWRTERGLEIALGRLAASSFPSEGVLEVGNVLPLAGVSGHTVIDKYEAGEGVINEDVVDYEPGRRFDLVVSISTIEHVGWDEVPQDLGKSGRALEVMRGLVAPGGAMLVTIPVGVRRELEEQFAADAPFDEVLLFAKMARWARWEQRDVADRLQYEYASPYACGNAVLVGVVGEPFRT